MKKVIISMLACMIAITASAQIVKDLKYPKGHFGIRGAFTSNTASRDNITGKSYPFASAGLAADFRIASIPLYLETGLYYMNRGVKGENDGHYYEDDDHGMMMPLLASYHLYFTDNMSIQPFVGPYIGYGFDSERIDYGIRTGIGWNFGRLYANAGYDFGFEVDGYKNNTVFVTIGFNFGGSY